MNYVMNVKICVSLMVSWFVGIPNRALLYCGCAHTSIIVNMSTCEDPVTLHAGAAHAHWAQASVAKTSERVTLWLL